MPAGRTSLRSSFSSSITASSVASTSGRTGEERWERRRGTIHRRRPDREPDDSKQPSPQSLLLFSFPLRSHHGRSVSSHSSTLDSTHAEILPGHQACALQSPGRALFCSAACVFFRFSDHFCRRHPMAFLCLLFSSPLCLSEERERERGRERERKRERERGE